MAQTVLKIADLMAMIYFSMQPHLWKRYPVTVSYPNLYIFLLVEYKNVILNLSSVFILYT